MALTQSVLYHFTYPDASIPVLAFYDTARQRWRFLVRGLYVYDWCEVSEADRLQAHLEHFQQLLATPAPAGDRS